MAVTNKIDKTIPIGGQFRTEVAGPVRIEYYEERFVGTADIGVVVSSHKIPSGATIVSAQIRLNALHVVANAGTGAPDQLAVVLGTVSAAANTPVGYAAQAALTPPLCETTALTDGNTSWRAPNVDAASTFLPTTNAATSISIIPVDSTDASHYKDLDTVLANGALIDGGYDFTIRVVYYLNEAIPAP